MSIERRRTEAVYAVIEELFANGAKSLRPGDVNTILRERNSPLGTWEVRAEFSRLEAEGRLVCDEDTGSWHLADASSLKGAAG